MNGSGLFEGGGGGDSDRSGITVIYKEVSPDMSLLCHPGGLQARGTSLGTEGSAWEFMEGLKCFNYVLYILLSLQPLVRMPKFTEIWLES